jgi:hypothetical protein
LYIWDDILWMNTHMDKCIEKAFNYLRNKQFQEQLQESDLPF